jgi:acetyltransferase-like isoleucine patch superfamily enzyme
LHIGTYQIRAELIRMTNTKISLKKYRILRVAKVYVTSALNLVLAVAAYIPSIALRKLVLRLYGVRLGKRVLIYHGFEIRAPRLCEIGDGTIIGYRATLDARGGLKIGHSVNLSSEVAIWTAEHDFRSPDFAYVSAPVVIGDRAWLSFRCTILPGVTIGEGAVVAAGAVVTKDVPPFTVVGGIPAKPIASRRKDLQYRFTNAQGLYQRFL